MFRRIFFFCALAYLVGASPSESANSLESCNRLCEEKYDLSYEDACLGGCRRGEAKHLDEKNTDGCESWCSSAHAENETMKEACSYGCNSYKPKNDGQSVSYWGYISSAIRNFYRNMMQRFKMPCAEVTTPEPTTDSPKKVGLIVIRRFRIRWPFGSDEVDPQMMNGPMPRGMMDHPMMHGPGMMMNGPDMMMSGPGGRMMHIGDEDAIENKLNFDDNVPLTHMMPRVVAVHAPESAFSGQVSYGLRYLASHPMVLLFTTTLVALCILLVVQLVLECRRRQRRASQFQYNQFDQLPTYVEATMIKVPSDGDFPNEMAEKPLKA